MGESPTSALPQLKGLAIEAVEWLPSGADSGLVRVRGRWTSPEAARPGLPELGVRAPGRAEQRFESLPDARFARDPASWRGSYLVPAALVAGGPQLWLEWPGGVRSGLPPLAAGLADVPVEVAAPIEEPAGGEVIDRAVLAERRARRAEAAEQAQARVAAEALKAVEALELQSAELERRLAERVTPAVDAGREAQLERDAERRAAALRSALDSLAHLRAQSRDWRLRLRTGEIAHAGDAVRLAVLEAERAWAGGALRAALHERGTELEAARQLAGERASALAAALAEAEAAREDLAAARAELEEAARRARGERAVHEEVRDALRARLDASEARVAELEAAAAAEIAARAAAEAQAAELRARVDDLEAALAVTETKLYTAAAAAAAAEARLRVESVARVALEDELDRERGGAGLATRLENERDEHADEAARLRAEIEAERTETARLAAAVAAERAESTRLAAAVEAERAERADEAARLGAAHAEAAGQLEAERAERAEESARLREAVEAARAEAARLAAAVDAERAARAAERDALIVERDEMVRDPALVAALASEQERRAALEAELEAARAELAALREELEAAREGGSGLLERIAELERTAAGRADEARLERVAQEQAEAAAAAARRSEEDAGRMRADLDAAAAALRQAAPVPPEEAPAGAEPAAEVHAEPADAVPTDAAPAEAEPPAGAEWPAAAPPRPRPTIVSASGPPPRVDATGRSARDYPPLRGAIVKLAHDDPEAAGRVIAALLPAQAAALSTPLDYDVTIKEVGTFAVTVAGTWTHVKALEQPRPRSDADFHLTADALTLAELLAGVPRRIGRMFGPARVKGNLRRAKLLKALAAADLSVSEAVQAGATLEPALVYRALAYAVHPSWTKGERFTVAQQITGGETWYLTARDGAGLAVSQQPPEEGVDATVVMTKEAFRLLLRGEQPPRGDRPIVRGDRRAVARMKAWADRAQGV